MRWAFCGPIRRWDCRLVRVDSGTSLWHTNTDVSQTSNRRSASGLFQQSHYSTTECHSIDNMIMQPHHLLLPSDRESCQAAQSADAWRPGLLSACFVVPVSNHLGCSRAHPRATRRTVRWHTQAWCRWLVEPVAWQRDCFGITPRDSAARIEKPILQVRDLRWHHTHRRWGRRWWR